MADDVIWQDGHRKCQGANCPNLVYAHDARWPHLCMDCVQPKLDQVRALSKRLLDGEISTEEHAREIEAIA